MNSNDDIRWQLRVSRRVRYARLQIRPYGGLEIVIPPRFPRREVPRLVEQHAAWIRRQLQRQARLRDAIALPERIHLRFDDSVISVEQGADPGPTPDLFSDEVLRLEGRDFAARLAELRGWVRKRAQASLPPLLAQCSRRTGLDYNRVTIRSQKTRWGSCSARGNISLNDQLLFLPRETVEYLMIHELCHTRHLNHSRAYWELVASHCPGYAAHEKRLSKPRDWIPDWFLLTLYA